jgi:hypothetical protein
MRDRAGRAHTSTNEEIESFHVSAVDLEQYALKSYVGNPMLAARIWAPGEMDLDIFAKSRNAVLELVRELDAQELGLSDSELAELTASAR